MLSHFPASAGRTATAGPAVADGWRREVWQGQTGQSDLGRVYLQYRKASLDGSFWPQTTWQASRGQGYSHSSVGLCAIRGSFRCYTERLHRINTRCSAWPQSQRVHM